MSELTREIEKMEAKIEGMQKQLDRAKELNKLLGDNLSYEDACCAISWLLHSDLTPVAIMNNIKED